MSINGPIYSGIISRNSRKSQTIFGSSAKALQKCNLLSLHLAIWLKEIKIVEIDHWSGIAGSTATTQAGNDNAKPKYADEPANGVFHSLFLIQRSNVDDQPTVASS